MKAHSRWDIAFRGILVLKEVVLVVFLYLMAHTRVKNGRINALLYRIGLPSNTATPVPLF